jgi:peroxiredoxin
MANNLTGDFDAIFQISVRRVNGILATMHQSRVNPDASPTFEHSSSVRVGDLPLILQRDSVQFSKWVAGAVQELRETGVLANDARSLLSEKAPPGVSAVLKKGWRDLDVARLEPAASGAVRGKAEVQLSAPTISLAGGAGGEVTVHVFIRVHYVPDAGSAAMPEPIHGEVQATYIVKAKAVGTRTAMSVQVSSHDNQIQFIPRTGSGLSAADADTISARVRKALRTQFVAADVLLPDGFPFAEFTALGGGPSQALALPLQLSGSAPAGNINSVTNYLLGTSEFAIAVSKEYIQSQFAPVIQGMKDYVDGITINVDAVIASTVYHASLSGVSLTWKAGAIDFSGHVDLKTRSIAPNLSFDFVQTITLALDVPSQTVKVVPVGDPVISNASTGVPTGQVVAGIRNGRDSALSKLSLQTVNDVRNQLISSLRRFDNFADARYATIEVTPDGMVLRGAIGPKGTGWRLDPVVHFSVTADGTGFTAFDSWIPGGRIERYRWTWPVGGSVGAIIAMKVGSKSDDDRFILPMPSDVGPAGRICLRIEGTRITPDGFEEQVNVGETCKPFWSEPILVAPYGSLDVLDPIWNPPNVEQPLDFSLDDAIAGHVSVVGQSRAPGGLSTNTLIHFAGINFERPLQTLSQALSQMRRPHISLVLRLILPTGTFATRLSELQARLGSLDERFSRNLHITEDYEGGWTQAFAATDRPSTHLINARGEFVWKQEGRLEAGRLAAALDEHLVPAPAPRSVLLRLTVQPGERAPDAVFQDDQGGRVTMRRLRGQPVLLTFWKSWSVPCIRELGRLQTLQDQGVQGVQGVQGTGHAPLIIAVNGGEDRAVLAEVRRQNKMTFPLIPDPDRSIGALYGVQCWPTTVSINQEGVIDRIHFGLAHEPRETGDYARS